MNNQDIIYIFLYKKETITILFRNTRCLSPSFFSFESASSYDID